MCSQDIEARRARDLARFHRRTAERRARGLCLKCGKCPPADGRTVCEPCAAKKRPADRDRYHRRAAARIAQGLCPKCGKQPPEAGLIHCAPCTEKRNRASRARDARLRAAGQPRRDIDKARAYNKAHSRLTDAERRAQGLCPKCGKGPPEPGRSICAPCAETHRANARARYADAKAAGKLYGGRDPEGRRKLAREKSRRRHDARRDAGLCTHCGRRPPVEGGATCEPCLEARREAERQVYAERRAMVCAPVAVWRPSTASRDVPCARFTSPGARSRRTPRTAGATPSGATRACAPHAASQRWGHRSVRRARSVRTSARTTTAGCRSIRRATPSSSWRRGSTTGRSTARPT